MNEKPDNYKSMSSDELSELEIGSNGRIKSNRTDFVSDEELGLKRKKSLVRPDRARTLDKRKHSLKRDFMRDNTIKNTHRKSKNTINSKIHNKHDKLTCWKLYCYLITFFLPPFILKYFKKSAMEQQACREKLGLVFIIIFLCAAVGFLTFGLQEVLCGINSNNNRLPYSSGINNDQIVINGQVYSIKNFNHPSVDGVEGSIISQAGGKDLSFLFQTTNQNCKNYFVSSNNQTASTYFPCIVTDLSLSSTPINSNSDDNTCHLATGSRNFKLIKQLGDIYYTWNDINKSPNRYIIYNGAIMDTKKLQYLSANIEFTPELNKIINSQSGYLNTDLSYLLGNNNNQLGKCVEQILKVGVLDTNSIGCISSDIILYVSLIVIIGVVLAKFFMALLFNWHMGRQLGRLKSETEEDRVKRIELIEQWSKDVDRPGHEYAQNNVARFSTTNFSEKNRFSNISLLPTKRSSFLPQTSRFSIPSQAKFHDKSNKRSKSQFNPFNESQMTQESLLSTEFSYETLPNQTSQLNITNRHVAPTPPPLDFQPYEFPLAHTLLLVTCYSEEEKGLRSTFDSLALTDYPNSHKMLFVVCDGVITGSGNNQSTPEICLSMMKDFVLPIDEVQAYSYVAIVEGSRRHNKAKVYAGYYKFDDKTVDSSLHVKVPMILVVKVGTEEEEGTKKAGNRGKRDSQIVLMSFLQRIMFDERLSELDYQLFNAMWNLSGVTPDSYEICLMVDADTKVYPDSLTKMVSVMVKDEKVMGLCGETKIANKSQSWVTMIQVFEYYISHHMSKAFESMFGGVTCLPGCFCMYRIKAPKGPNGHWTPILANPDIVEYYSENSVKSLHEKNLLLLGEDRYLTTLMLKTFPKRKMLFVPQAICKTLVPDTFKILLSQRRRWINSTVHNLLELVLIRDLCGTFCFSMQFVIFMELIGTVVLPAAITFTIYLIVISTFTRPVPIIPLTLLAAILGLPAILILFTTRKVSYIGWMLIYLLSLPIWNFVLPVYSFWNFDDFSWGETRQVEGEKKGAGHEEGGVFNESMITMKRWEDFERENRKNLSDYLVHFFMSNGNQSELDKKLNEIGYLAPNIVQKLFVESHNFAHAKMSSASSSAE